MRSWPTSAAVLNGESGESSEPPLRGEECSTKVLLGHYEEEIRKECCCLGLDSPVLSAVRHEGKGYTRLASSLEEGLSQVSIREEGLKQVL